MADSFAEGVRRFNRGDYWGAHESWELLWLVLRGPFRDFIRGLIQLAAAFHHIHRRNLPGATRLFQSALDRLDRFPESTAGVVFGPAATVARVVQGTADAQQTPHLELTADWRQRLLAEVAAASV